VQDVHAYELSQAGYYHTTTCHDGTNAFWSMSHEHLEQATAPPFVATEREHNFVRQRLRYATVLLGAGTDDATHMLVQSGVIPGDHAGPRIFNRGMVEPVRRARARARLANPWKEQLYMTCFFIRRPGSYVHVGVRGRPCLEAHRTYGASYEPPEA